MMQGWRGRKTHSWEVAEGEDAEQTSFPARTVPDDHKFPAKAVQISIRGQAYKLVNSSAHPLATSSRRGK